MQAYSYCTILFFLLAVLVAAHDESTIQTQHMLRARKNFDECGGAKELQVLKRTLSDALPKLRTSLKSVSDDDQKIEHAVSNVRRLLVKVEDLC
ncbi:hypothetical protein MVES1_002938 [Malassezia vespertilionis]|uniref:Uncharacterized protein n=1 Tax=Malassezia vespertilionis TaxID=2020962 RepID=A0A2N1J9V9_9BASI|nr:uncharacterized protein MVES1_002938 [Malassezia vespertilionis]PKI83341.1 hypothetical protein MVES_002787 [Malassezia vespertilionis]WFD07571.1 hypothetical protein MVES1_002938 [Malassezia vespertilionis]